MMKPALLLFLSGAILGPIGDLCHVISQTTAYPKEIYSFYFFGLIPFWVPFLFGSASLLIGISHPLADKLLAKIFKEPRLRPGEKNHWLAYMGPLFFLGSYCLSGFMSQRGDAAPLIFPDIILAFLAILTWITLDRTWQGILTSVLTAVSGTAVEIFLVKAEVFSYQNYVAGGAVLGGGALWVGDPHVWGVPMWLPWLYVIASITIGNVGRVLFRSSFRA